MNRKHQKQLEEVAEKVLQETGYDYLLPVNVEAVAARKGLGILPYDFGEEISGVLIVEGQKATIGYNVAFDGHSKRQSRKRFTIAHELGHFVLNHQRVGAFVDTPSEYFTILYRDQKSSTGEFWQEREANAFAAALLMPRKALLEEMKKIWENDSILRSEEDVVEILARKFEVSTQAMAFRLTNLDLLW